MPVAPSQYRFFDIETRMPTGPNLKPPYYNEKGKLLTDYDSIRSHQDAVVKAFVGTEIARNYEGLAATPELVHDMKRSALGMLYDQKAKGNIHPHASIEDWLDHSDRKLLKWKSDECKEAWPWMPYDFQHAKKCDKHLDGYAWDLPRPGYTLDETMRGVKWNGNVWVPDKKQQLKDKIYRQMNPPVLNHLGELARGAKVSFKNAKENEIIALQLLRQMTTPEVFRKYLRQGFVTVVGTSGLTYVIKRSNKLIDVWDFNTKIATLCVHAPNHIPPTDGVVAKMLICECDEPDIWKRANVAWKVREGLSERARRFKTPDAIETMAAAILQNHVARQDAEMMAHLNRVA